jgi:hypothetical protein
MPAVVVDTDVASYLHKKDSRAAFFGPTLLGANGHFFHDRGGAG